MDGSVKLEGTGKAGASTTFTVTPGKTNTTSTQVTDVVGSPKTQMAAAMNNINTGSKNIASSIENGKVTMNNPVVGVKPGFQGPPAQTGETFTLINTGTTNQSALRAVHNMSTEAANKDNPVKIKENN